MFDLPPPRHISTLRNLTVGARVGENHPASPSNGMVSNGALAADNGRQSNLGRTAQGDPERRLALAR
jgi:hypothetical protein